MSICARNAELAALLKLRAALSLVFAGFDFQRGLSGGICVSVRGRSLGVWWFDQDRYHFAATAYRTPERSVSSPAKVVEVTSEIAFGSTASFFKEQI